MKKDMKIGEQAIREKRFGGKGKGIKNNEAEYDQSTLCLD